MCLPFSRRSVSSLICVAENYDYLHDLLEELVPTERSSTISGWINEGQLLWDYLRIVAKVETLLAKQDLHFSYELEKLQPELSCLCTRINMLPCLTAVDKYVVCFEVWENKIIIMMDRGRTTTSGSSPKLDRDEKFKLVANIVTYTIVEVELEITNIFVYLLSCLLFKH